MDDSLKVGLGLGILILTCFGMLAIGVTIENNNRLKCLETVSAHKNNVSEIKDICGVR